MSYFKKKTFILLVIPLVILSFYLFKSYFSPSVLNKTQNNSNSYTRSIYINNHKLDIEIADNDRLREKGLSGRKFLAKNSGMLFIFPDRGYHYFWMKEMKFPLDFVWINKNKVADVTKNVSPPFSFSDKLPAFTSQEPFDKVLEINAGTVNLLGIKKGDDVTF